ncbi:TPA: hypothetical protein KNK42_003576 [Clostridioides difficile]|uniref:Uncharacterized protein n=2 Tax=root TaxID=1 RepID=A3QSB8_9CAUD|nr:hypothetical protein [Clostridioides difficile]YP_001110745.1 rhodanese-related sulfurtransferase [Clostridioides phage phiC2]EQK93099.1 hypothetical protein QEG_0862 [Clostridioides difficile CD127]OFU10580.1 hypothetical protein HMPREF3081_07165 [Clostridium sp. HMSC19D02]OFU10784.1 hypothetical protein HMPREF3080_09055 [Clostridium sp. HMSC19C11]DAG69510.1 MAG TPA: hypothetical protein [Caudoviricetes sp.]ABE99490.1 hypothetical protein phiC2p29 [Clostridioides phage phiC2]
MNRNNRIIYDQTGNIWLQTGEATGDIQEWSKITELNFLDVEFGSIDYSKQYIESINPVTKEPIIKDIEVILTDEQKRLQALEKELSMLKEENKNRDSEIVNTAFEVENIKLNNNL